MNVTVQRQISVALENQPGRLGDVGRLMAGRGVDITALTVIDNVEQGMVRMVTDDPEAGRAALQDAGLPVVEAEVLVLEVASGAGALAAVAERLAAAEINIEYAYATEVDASERTKMVLKTANPHAALDVLAAGPDLG